MCAACLLLLSCLQFSFKTIEISVCRLLMAIQSLWMAVQRLRMCIQSLQTEILLLLHEEFMLAPLRFFSVLLEDVRCTFARVFRFSWKAYACCRQSLVRFWGWFLRAYWGMLVGCGGEFGRLRGQAVQTVANENGAPTSWRPTQCYLNQISSYQIETVSTIQINLMKIY